MMWSVLVSAIWLRWGMMSWSRFQFPFEFELISFGVRNFKVFWGFLRCNYLLSSEVISFGIINTLFAHQKPNFIVSYYYSLLVASFMDDNFWWSGNISLLSLDERNSFCRRPRNLQWSDLVGTNGQRSTTYTQPQIPYRCSCCPVSPNTSFL